MNTTTYDVNAKAETGWTSLSVALGAVVGAILQVMGVDATITGAVVGATVGLTRWAIGHFLPPTKPEA